MSLNNREKIIGVFSRTAMAFAIVLAWCGTASASTVAYWPLNYTAAERTTTQTDLTNLGTATELVARPISMIGETIQEGSSASCPVGTNAFPTGFAVYDPVTSNTLDAATALHFHLPDNRDTEGSGAIRVSNTAALRLTTFTVEFFIRIRQQYTATQMDQYHAVAVMPRILRNGDVVVRNCDSWGIRFSENGLQFRFSNADYSYQSGNPGLINTSDYRNFIVSYPALNDGDWHHVALTVDGTYFKVYIDYRPMDQETWMSNWVAGVADSSRLADPVSYGTEDLYIGAVPMVAQPFGGDLAHFRISDKVLNAAELLRPVRSARAPDEADDVYLHMSFEQEPGFAAGMYFDRTGSQKVIQRRSAQIIMPKLDADICAQAIRPSLTNAVAAVNATSLVNAPVSNANSYVEIQPTSDPFPTSSYTVECFYRAKTTNEFSTVGIPLVRRLFNASGNAQFQLALLYDSWKLCGSVREAGANGSTTISDSDSSTTDVWHHAAFVVDSDKKIMRLFHDYARVAEGSFSATTASAPPSTDTCLVIAGAPRGTNSNVSLNGWVDDVRITLRALEPGEFLSKGYFNPAERTLAWMSFDNGDLNGGPGLTNGVAAAGEGGSQPTFPAYPGNTYFVMDGAGNVIRKDTHAISFQKGQVVWAESPLLSLFPAQTVEFFVKANGTPTAGEAILRNSLFAHTSIVDTSAWLATFGISNPTHMRLLCATINDATGAKEGKGINVDTGVVIGDGAWHHVAITFDPSAQGETISVYADYSPTPNWTTTLTGKRIYGKGFGAVWAGAAPTVDKYYFNGQLDEVRISQGVLTPSQFLHRGNVGFMVIVR